MQDEIVAGIKNAMERGESLEQAMQSFINAGYNSAEVQAAGSMLSEGAIKIANTEQPITPEVKKPLPVFSAQNPNVPVQQSNVPAQAQSVPIEVQRRSRKKVLILIVILMALIFFVGGLVYFILNL